MSEILSSQLVPFPPILSRPVSRDRTADITASAVCLQSECVWTPQNVDTQLKTRSLWFPQLHPAVTEVLFPAIFLLRCLRALLPLRTIIHKLALRPPLISRERLPSLTLSSKCAEILTS